jgi:hypothetical protein
VHGVIWQSNPKTCHVFFASYNHHLFAIKIAKFPLALV